MKSAANIFCSSVINIFNSIEILYDQLIARRKYHLQFHMKYTYLNSPQHKHTTIFWLYFEVGLSRFSSIHIQKQLIVIAFKILSTGNN